jgi:hypothetical protein
MIKEMLYNDIEINYKKKLTVGRTKSHYKISPYRSERDNVYKLEKIFNRELSDSLIEIIGKLDDK